MPRAKIYNKERKAFTVRFDNDRYVDILRRARQLKLSLQQYLNKLVEDDLIVARIEERNALIKKEKGNN